MVACAIKWCGKRSAISNYKKDGITYHSFPTDPHIKSKWIEVARRENWYPKNYSKVCSRHFTPDCFHKHKDGRRRLYKTSIPTKHLPLVGTRTEQQACGEASSSSDETPLASTRKTKKSPFLVVSNSNPIIVPSTQTPKPDPNDPEKKQLRRRVLELLKKINEKNKQLKRLSGEVRYLTKKVGILNEVVKELRND